MDGNPDDATLKDLLTRYRRVAVVGFSKDPAKEAHSVPLILEQRGYHIIPVNPTATEIAGMRVHSSLTAVPEDYDIVDIFRPGEAVGPIVDEAIEHGKAKVIWMQLGITNEAAAAKARAAGLVVVQDRCMKRETTRLLGFADA